MICKLDFTIHNYFELKNQEYGLYDPKKKTLMTHFVPPIDLKELRSFGLSKQPTIITG